MVTPHSRLGETSILAPRDEQRLRQACPVNGDQEARLFGGEMAVLAQAGEVWFW